MADDTAIVPATLEHAVEMAPRMRLADRREIWASGRHQPTRALMRSVRRSSAAWTGTVGGRPVCMFGCAPVTIIGNVGVPWLLGTDDLPRYAMRFLRRNRAVIDGWLQRYSLLSNYVDARNAASLAWLRWLGFDIMEAEPFGPFKMPFHRFEMRA